MAKYLDIEGRQVPQPEYKRDADKLVAEYQKAFLAIKAELERTDISNLSRANALALLKEIEKALNELDLFAKEWIAANIPQAATDGTAAALVNLGLAASLEEARKVVKFNKLNRELVDLAISDMQTDVLDVTKNVKKRLRNTIRRVVGEVMRANMAKGVNGRKTMNADMLSQLRKELGETIEAGIIDSGRNRWKPVDYIDMLSRTKMMETYRQAQTNEAVGRGANYAIISYAGAKDACRFHEGRIIKLVPQAEGNYPTYDELKASNQIFHPRCRHHFTVIRDIDRLPPDVLKSAENQARRGDAALATGKRNPTNIE